MMVDKEEKGRMSQKFIDQRNFIDSMQDSFQSSTIDASTLLIFFIVFIGAVIIAFVSNTYLNKRNHL